MMDRKKKLRLYQLSFFIAGIIMILFTLINKNEINQERIISKNLEKNIEKKMQSQKDNPANVFYNVKYSGIDLEGNRYTIISDEAINSDSNLNIVEMRGVLATFYFKDNTILYVSSDEGNYNNQNLDMTFKKNVEATYENSKLFAEKAEFSNANNLLIVSNDVKILDAKGTMFADKLIFDIKSKTLNITSLKDNLIKSIINYK